MVLWTDLLDEGIEIGRQAVLAESKQTLERLLRQSLEARQGAAKSDDVIMRLTEEDRLILFRSMRQWQPTVPIPAPPPQPFSAFIADNAVIQRALEGTEDGIERVLQWIDDLRAWHARHRPLIAVGVLFVGAATFSAGVDAVLPPVRSNLTVPVPPPKQKPPPPSAVPVKPATQAPARPPSEFRSDRISVEEQF